MLWVQVILYLLLHSVHHMQTLYAVLHPMECLMRTLCRVGAVRPPLRGVSVCCVASVDCVHVMCTLQNRCIVSSTPWSVCLLGALHGMGAQVLALCGVSAEFPPLCRVFASCIKFADYLNFASTPRTVYRFLHSMECSQVVYSLRSMYIVPSLHCVECFTYAYNP